MWVRSDRVAALSQGISGSKHLHRPHLGALQLPWQARPSCGLMLSTQAMAVGAWWPMAGAACMYALTLLPAQYP